MTRSARAVPLLALVLAAPAAAQVDDAVERANGLPAGLALPVFGVAAAEEPSALTVNPAGPGFVRELALQYFHEDGGTTTGADGVYATLGLGGLALSYGHEWVRRVGGGDERAPFPRYRRATWGLALGDGRESSVGVAWNRWASPDAALDDLSSFDVGLTWRPFRHLSLAAAARDLEGRLGGERLPVRWSIGVATRLLDDRLTLAGDFLADDRGRGRFRGTYAVASAAAELTQGVALGVQVQLPVREGTGIENDPVAMLAVSWNGAHGGWTGGFVQAPDEGGWLTGVRLSGERYRGDAGGGSAAPRIDVEDVLEPRRTLFLALSDRDPWSTLVRKLEAARDDDGVKALVLELEGLPISYGRAEELRALVAGVRERKPVLAYLRGGGTVEYYLATAASAIAAPPTTTLFVNGIGTGNLYLQEGLARLGVAVEAVRAGRYKTAPEPLTRAGPSDEAREVANAVLDDVFGRVVRAIAEARRLPEAEVRRLVDRGLFTGETAREAGLVDAVVWPDGLEAWVRATARARLAGGYEPEGPRAAQRWGKPDQIALVRVDGAIVNGKSRRTLGGDAIAGAETISKEIRRAVEDPGVKAIVVRIDSPGGDGFASDLVWRELVHAREKRKPVVASLGDVAASGGYLVAAAADVIVAEPSTLTGSIGVFALKPDLSALLGNLSVRREAYARGETAQLFSVAKPWSEAERRAVEDQVDRFYRQFVARVAEGRRLAPEAVESVAAGRVWTGAQAMERRLVDRVGTLADAIAIARSRAGLGEDAEVRRADGGQGPLGRVLTRAADAPPPIATAVAALLPELRAAAMLAEMGLVLALPEPWLDGAGLR